MDHVDKNPESECCARCRWLEIKAQPYGAVEYACENRKESVPSALVAKRRCGKFER